MCFLIGLVEIIFWVMLVAFILVQMISMHVLGMLKAACYVNLCVLILSCEVMSFSVHVVINWMINSNNNYQSNILENKHELFILKS